jgi:hypothetical protein
MHVALPPDVLNLTPGRPCNQESFWRRKLPWFAVFGGVVQPDFAAGALLRGVDDASVERAGIDVQTDGALIEFAGIEDAMNGR